MASEPIFDFDTRNKNKVILSKVFGQDNLCLESDAERALVALFQSNGLSARRQVQAGKRTADIVVYDSENFPSVTIELKMQLTSDRERRKAFDQVTAYADDLDSAYAVVSVVNLPRKYVGVFNGVHFCRIEDTLPLIKELLYGQS